MSCDGFVAVLQELLTPEEFAEHSGLLIEHQDALRSWLRRELWRRARPWLRKEAAWDGRVNHTHLSREPMPADERSIRSVRPSDFGEDQ
jgi:hypothetical protein